MKWNIHLMILMVIGIVQALLLVLKLFNIVQISWFITISPIIAIIIFSILAGILLRIVNDYDKTIDYDI